MNHQFMEVTFTRIAQFITPIAICFSRITRLQALTTAGMVLLLCSHAAWATAFGKLIQPFGSYGFTADDNMLRIRDGMNPVPLLGMSNLFDISHRFTGGVMFEKEVGRQRLNANLNWSHTRFEKFDQMTRRPAGRDRSHRARPMDGLQHLSAPPPAAAHPRR